MPRSRSAATRRASYDSGQRCLAVQDCRRHALHPPKSPHGSRRRGAQDARRLCQGEHESRSRRPSCQMQGAVRRDTRSMGLTPVPAKCGPGQIHGDAGRLRRGDHVLVADRPARLHDRTHTGIDQTPAARPGTGRTHPMRPQRRPPGHRLAPPPAGRNRRGSPAPCRHRLSLRRAREDRVGLHRPHRPPREDEVGQRCILRRIAGRQVVHESGSSPGASMRSARCSNSPPLIGRLSTAGSAATGAATSRRRFFLARNASSASSSKAGAHDHLGEDVGELRGHRRRDGPVRRDHTAVGADRIARVRLAVRLGDVRADRDAARVGVLDDRDARLVEVVGGAARRLGVDVVVVAHLLAGQLLGLRQPAPPGVTYSAADWCGFSP